MQNKNIKVKLNTRFVICIDENLENVYLKDLEKIDERFSATECLEILKECIEEIKIISGTIENKIQEKERIRNKERTFKNLKVVK